MKTYTFVIKTLSSVIGNGELFESMTVFNCQFTADRDTEINAFAEQLFSFWEKSNVMGDAHKNWKYEFTVELP